MIGQGTRAHRAAFVQGAGRWMDLRGTHTAECSAPEAKLANPLAQNAGSRMEQLTVMLRRDHSELFPAMLPAPHTTEVAVRKSQNQLNDYAPQNKRPSIQRDAAGGGPNAGNVAGQVRWPTSQLKPDRKAWTRVEDEVISVCTKLGHGKLEADRRLPGRSDDAIQNRWSRLQAPTHLRGPQLLPQTPANDLLVPTWVVSLVIPANWRPGMKMATTLKNGRRVIITPPNDAKPGMPLKCKVLATAADTPTSTQAPAPVAKTVEVDTPRPWNRGAEEVQEAKGRHSHLSSSNATGASLKVKSSGCLGDRSNARHTGAFNTATKGAGPCATTIAAQEQSEEAALLQRNNAKLAALSARAIGITEVRGSLGALCDPRQVRRLLLARACPACRLALPRSTLPLPSLCTDCLRALQPNVLAVPSVRHPLVRPKGMPAWPVEADEDEAPQTKRLRSEAPPETRGGLPTRSSCEALRHAPRFHLAAGERRMAFPLPSFFTESQGPPESSGEKRRKRSCQPAAVGHTNEAVVKENELHLESWGLPSTRKDSAAWSHQPALRDRTESVSVET